MSFKSFMELYFTAAELKALCRKHAITWFSKGPKAHIIQLIEAAYRADPGQFLDGYLNDDYTILAYLILEGRNSIPIERTEQLNTRPFIVNTDRLMTVCYTPADTFDMLIAFFKENKMHPLDYIAPEDKVLYQNAPALKAFNTAQ